MFSLGVCGSGGNTTVHFLVPNAADSLNNRFTPTYRVLTDVVVTIDDDIEVTEPDLVRMARILRAQRLQRIVSPYPRWHDVRGNYLWLPTRAEHVGYVVLFCLWSCSPSHDSDACCRCCRCRGFISDGRCMVRTGFMRYYSCHM